MYTHRKNPHTLKMWNKVFPLNILDRNKEKLSREGNTR